MKTLSTYNDVKALLQKFSDAFDQEVYKQASELLERLHDFATKHGVQCEYRLALPSKEQPAGRLVNAGIEIGKVRLPKTLIAYLQSKVGMNVRSMNKLYAALLKHQKFDIAMSGTRLRAKLQGDKFATESA